jgi:hypothetical protein
MAYLAFKYLWHEEHIDWIKVQAFSKRNVSTGTDGFFQIPDLAGNPFNQTVSQRDLVRVILSETVVTARTARNAIGTPAFAILG